MSGKQIRFNEKEIYSIFEKWDKSIFVFLVAIVLFMVYLASDLQKVYQIMFTGSFAFITSTIINLILKSYLRASRPQSRVASKDHILTPIVRYSFPSYHTQIGFTMVTVAGMFLWEHSVLFPVILFALAIFVSYTRIALNAHYWKDVLAGAIIGGTIGLLSFLWLGYMIYPMLAIFLFLSTIGLMLTIPFGAPEK